MNREDMNRQLMAAYVEAYCGLVCPFPILSAMRANLRWVAEQPELYASQLAKEKAHNEKKYAAELRYWKLLNEAKAYQQED